MNAESTPLRNEFNVTTAFSAITPITEDNFGKSNSLSKGIKRNIDSSGEIDEEPTIRSQVHRNTLSKRKESIKERISKRTFSLENNCSGNSEELIDDEYLCSSPKSDYHTSKIQFLDSGIDKLLVNMTCGLDQNFEVLSNSRTSRDFKAELHKNESLDESLSVSDVMNWNDESLIPQEDPLRFPKITKRKLFENANNENVIKSQTSGWTQYEISGLESQVINDIGCFYGLPLKVQELYKEHKGISELFAWQEDCLSLDAVKRKKNLVFSLPTSGGKSLVAEILILKEVLIHKKNVLFILPFVSIVQEKVRDFSHFALEFKFALEEYAAGKGCIPPRKHTKKNSLMIATIEKGLIVVSSLIEANRLEEIGLVVVDELHLLLEEGRGPVLEILLTQLLHLGGKIQIIGMTATIGNLEEVATFMMAESYADNFRPLRLLEYIKCGNKIFSVDLASKELVNEIRTLDSPFEEDTDGIAQLVQEVIPEHSVLVFCPTKKNCENVAALLSQVLPRRLTEYKQQEKASLYRALTSETNEKVCPILKQTLPFGVVYHHSGLTVGERKLLEEGFRQGTILVICCTSTLAVGVNLPAKRVILRSPYVGRDFISLSKYKQMVGRAGRTGFRCEGESFLICQAADMMKVKNLFSSQMDEVISKMDVDNCQSLILSSIGLRTATTRKSLKALMKCSLLHRQSSKLNKDTGEIVDECIERLHKKGALILKHVGVDSSTETAPVESEPRDERGEKCIKITDDCELKISRLGRAAVKGGFSLETAQELYKDLFKAQEKLVLLTNLHLLYLATPYDFTTQIKPNFSIFFNIYMRLDAKDVHAARVIGITESVVSKLAVGSRPKTTKDAILNRFYASLILYELWNQKTVWDVAQSFQLPRGLVQTLTTSAASFVNGLLRFCEEFEEFWSFKALFSDFAPRLAHCCAPELLPLMDLPAVKRGRAKQLYDAGFKTLQLIAVAAPADLVRSLDHMPYSVASQIVAAAKLLLMEKVESLREEAEIVLEGLSQKFT